MEEEKIELTDCSAETDGILSADADAMLVFHGTEDWGQLQLFFSDSVQDDCTAEWYYSPSDFDRFDRFRRQEAYITAGTEKANIVLPGRHNGNLRLNIHGDFRLSSIAVTERI